MVDNYEAVRSVLKFDDADSLYTIQLLQRRKDVPDLDKGCKKLRTYYIRKMEDYEKNRDSIVRECDAKKARAYIDLNAKDIKKVALLALKKTADLIYNNEFDAVKNAYDYACGNVCCLGQKKWLIDIDTLDTDTVREVCSQVTELGAEVVLQVPSKNGVHLVTTPFAVNKFKTTENVDIQKHHALTLLYMPDIKDDESRSWKAMQ